MLKEKNSTKIHKIQGDWLLEEEKFNLTVSQFLRNAQNQTVSKAREAIGSVAKYINKSPSVKTFVYSTAILSAIPVGIFSIFIGITMAFSICTAVMGVLLVQSGAVIVGGAFLLPIEAGILCIAGGTSTNLNQGATVVGYVTGASNLLITKPSKPKMERYESLLLKEGQGNENTTIIE